MHEEVISRARRELGRPAAPPSGVGRSSALPLRRRPMHGDELQEAARVLAGAGRRGGGGAGEGPEQGGAACTGKREGGRRESDRGER